MTKFDGKKIRDEILADLKKKIAASPTEPILAVIWVGDDPISEKYIRSKQKAADYIGVDFQLIKLSDSVRHYDIIAKLIMLSELEFGGIMIQMPLPAKINRQRIIAAIPRKKDVDGLRFCAGLSSKFQPPVVLAILEAIKESKIDIQKSRLAIIGQGFLVGAPLKKILKSEVKELLVADITTNDLPEITKNADVIISAAGQPGLITAEMVKNGVVLIDAGTSEVGGKIVGDIEPAAYQKSSFYTPVPGGIGPLTVAMLYKNLVATATKLNDEIRIKNDEKIKKSE